MAFLVEISPSALLDAETAFLKKQKEDPINADDWFNGLLDAVYSLEQFPNRCPLAPEGREMGIELRNLLYNKTHRIFFVVVDEGESEDVDGVVQVLRIRHYRQAPLTEEDL